MKYKELNALSKSELEKKLKESHLSLLKLRVQVNQGTVLKKPSEIRQIKKTIARIASTKKLEVQ